MTTYLLLQETLSSALLDAFICGAFNNGRNGCRADKQSNKEPSQESGYQPSHMAIPYFASTAIIAALVA